MARGKSSLIEKLCWACGRMHYWEKVRPTSATRQGVSDKLFVYRAEGCSSPLALKPRGAVRDYFPEPEKTDERFDY